MKKIFYYLCTIILLFASVSVSPLLAKMPIERKVESATNADGSALQIVTTTNGERMSRDVKVYYRAHPEQQMQVIWKSHFSIEESYATGITQITDWNQDGVNDISITLVCGAGPDCETHHHRIDSKTRKLTAVGTTFGTTTKP